jgi:hypothetical protein
VAVRRVLALGLLLLVLSACGGDDGGGGGDGPGERSVSAGLLVGQQADDGRLIDTLELIDPERPGDETVDVADVSRGIPVGVNQALYESGAQIVLLDADGGDVTDLGLQIGDIDLAYSRASVAPGGDRYVVLLAPTGEGAALVDLEDATVTDLLAELDEATVVLGAEMADDGSAVLLNTDDGVHVVPTDAPDEPERVGDGAGQLLDGGSSVLLTSADGVIVRDLDSGDETNVSDGSGGALAVGSRILVGQGDEAVLVDPGSDDVVASAPFSTEGAAPVAVGDTVLLPGDGGWTLVDGVDGTTTPLPDLDGLTPAFSGRPSRWVPFGDESGRGLVAVDTEDGSVVTVLDLGQGAQVVGLPALADAGPGALVSTDDPDGTVALLVDLDTGETQELGAAIQGASFSPDGAQVAWSSGDDAELRVGPVDDVASAEVVTDGIALPVWLNGG